MLEDLALKREAYNIRQRDENTLFVGPHVEMGRVQPRGASGVWRHEEITPEHVYELLLVVHVQLPHHVLSKIRVGSIGPDQVVEIDPFSRIFGL